MTLRGTAVAALLLVTSLPIGAQQPAITAPAVTISYERRLDPWRWHVDNPSRFDTAELVPHFFEQRYDGNSHWLRAVARYRAAAFSLETLGAFSAPQVTTGDDFDTFLQPGGDVVVSGTTGDVTLQSWRLRQRVWLPAGARVGLHASYGYTRDRARFHAGNKIVTHTIPPSIERSVVTTRETTWSEVHDMHFGVEPAFTAGAWQIVPRLAAGPAIGRLTVQLPDKYPGIDLRFPASLVSADAGLTVQRPIGRLLLSAGADYTHTWSLYDHSRLRRRALTLSAGLGLHP